MAKKHILFRTDVFDRMESTHEPSSALEVLMQMKPGEEPPYSEDISELREAVVEAVMALPERQRKVIELLLHESKSLRAAGSILGYSDVHIMRIRDTAFRNLRSKLEMNPLIRKKYNMAKTWGQSAAQWCGHLASMSGATDTLDFGALRDRIDALIGITFHNDSEPNANAFVVVASPVISYLRSLDEWDTGRMAHLLSSKQHDYGHKNIDRFGIKGIIVRLNDKYERLANLEFSRMFLKEGKATSPRINESFIDTLVDIVGYCVIGLMVLDETFKLELGEEDGFSAGDTGIRQGD